MYTSFMYSLVKCKGTISLNKAMINDNKKKKHDYFFFKEEKMTLTEKNVPTFILGTLAALKYVLVSEWKY